jgi:RNA polymerase sigma-70 factor, ECF subfamily
VLHPPLSFSLRQRDTQTFVDSPHEPDERLALRIQQGEQVALAALVERHHHRLIGFLYRLTGGDRALAEDLAQESFLRVLRSIGQYRYPRPFKAWLYAIATNIARDHYKSAESRRTTNTDDSNQELLPQYSEQPEETLLDWDEGQRVAAAITALPDHQREVVILRYYQELSLAEIAEALEIPVGTVKSRLSIGLMRLKNLLDEER